MRLPSLSLSEQDKSCTPGRAELSEDTVTCVTMPKCFWSCSSCSVVTLNLLVPLHPVFTLFLMQMVWRWSGTRCALKALSAWSSGRPCRYRWCWAVSHPHSHSVLAVLCHGSRCLCTFCRWWHRTPVRTSCLLRFLVGARVCVFSLVTLGVWGGRESSCRSGTANWACFFSSCFLLHFKTGVWCFSSVFLWIVVCLFGFPI